VFDAIQLIISEPTQALPSMNLSCKRLNYNFRFSQGTAVTVLRCGG